MKYLFYLFFIGALLVNTPEKNLSQTKITLSDTSDIKKLLNLGLNPNGYIINNRYWINDFSAKECSILKKNHFEYEVLSGNTEIDLESFVSFISGQIIAEVSNYGCRLDVYYHTQPERLSFLSIKIFDLEGEAYITKSGYNIPKGGYNNTLGCKDWPDSVYLIQMDNGRKETVTSFFTKEAMP